MATCVECHHQPPECNFTHPIPGQNVVQSYNLCGKCASEVWSKYKFSIAFSTLIITPPKSPSDFKKEALENGSDKYGSSWCEYKLLQKPFDNDKKD